MLLVLRLGFQVLLVIFSEICFHPLSVSHFFISEQFPIDKIWELGRLASIKFARDEIIDCQLLFDVILRAGLYLPVSIFESFPLLVFCSLITFSVSRI